MNSSKGFRFFLSLSCVLFLGHPPLSYGDATPSVPPAVSASPATFASASASPQAVGNWSEWKEAKAFYDSQKFDDALKELRSHPLELSAYYYNLGTTYYRLEQFGPAVAHLEKARRMHPDSDVQFNLTLARTSLLRVSGLENLDPASTGLESWMDQISAEAVQGLLGGISLIVSLLWLRAYRKTRSLKKMILSPAGLLGVLGCFAAVGLIGIYEWTAMHPPVICLERQIIRSGPGDHYLELGQAEAGVKYRLLGPSAPGENPVSTPEIWRQVRFSQSGVGWIRASSLLFLES